MSFKKGKSKIYKGKNYSHQSQTLEMKMSELFNKYFYSVFRQKAHDIHDDGNEISSLSAVTRDNVQNSS